MEITYDAGIISKTWLFTQKNKEQKWKKNENKKKAKKEKLTKPDFSKPGSVLLSRFRSTIAARAFRFPVRDGVERLIPRYDHQAN